LSGFVRFRPLCRLLQFPPFTVAPDLHCRAIKIGTKPCPRRSGRRAFPITAPNACWELQAFIAWPGVGEVVSKSPTSIDPYCASALQYTLPTRASGARFPTESRRSRIIPGLNSPAPEITPATFCHNSARSAATTRLHSRPSPYQVRLQTALLYQSPPRNHAVVGETNSDAHAGVTGRNLTSRANGGVGVYGTGGQYGGKFDGLLVNGNHDVTGTLTVKTDIVLAAPSADAKCDLPATPALVTEESWTPSPLSELPATPAPEPELPDTPTPELKDAPDTPVPELEHPIPRAASKVRFTVSVDTSTVSPKRRYPTRSLPTRQCLNRNCPKRRRMSWKR
jgi:hypothetical protein